MHFFLSLNFYYISYISFWNTTLVVVVQLFWDIFNLHDFFYISYLRNHSVYKSKFLNNFTW